MFGAGDRGPARRQLRFLLTLNELVGARAIVGEKTLLVHHHHGAALALVRVCGQGRRSCRAMA